MPALTGSRPARCFTHSPGAAEARAAARQRGAATTNGRRTTVRPETPAAAPIAFELGQITRSNIGATAVRLAQAIARGEVDGRRGRQIIEALRVAQASNDDEDFSDAERPPPGARHATRKEGRYMMERGMPPPGTESVMPPVLWLRGSIAANMVDDGDEDALPLAPPPPPPRQRKKRHRA